MGVETQKIFSAAAASATVEIGQGFEKCRTVIIEITTAGFTGTIDIKGRMHESAAYSNVPYIRQDQVATQTQSVDQLSYSGDTSVYRYAIIGFWPRLEVIMTRTAGTITCVASGSPDGEIKPVFAEPNSTGILSALTTAVSTLTSILSTVGSLVLAAGSAVIGKVRLVTASGDEVTDDTDDAIRVKPVDATASYVYNTTMTSANTEYSQALPANTKKFTVKLRDGTSFRLAFVTGKVATPTEPYLTINDGFGYSEDNVNLTSITLYFASAVAAKTAEIVAWV